jgi:hypothetical protein
MHGGADGSGAPRGARNGNYKHGFWTCEAVEERRWTKEMVQLYAEETDK